MLGCYLDESAVDGGSKVSAVGGLILDSRGYYWLHQEWERAIAKHRPGKSFIHMKDYGKDGDLRTFPVEPKRALFCDLVRIINSNKAMSLEGTLTPEQYRIHFSFLRKKGGLSIHATCFLLAAVTQGKWAIAANYQYDIPFLLDDGCPDRKDVDGAHDYLVNVFQATHPVHAGGLMWGNDEISPPLQAADVIAWAVHRRAAKAPFTNGYEPLEDIFDGKHFGNHFEDEWMSDVAINIRDTLGL